MDNQSIVIHAATKKLLREQCYTGETFNSAIERLIHNNNSLTDQLEKQQYIITQLAEALNEKSNRYGDAK